MTDGWLLALRIAGVGIGFPLLAWAFGSALLGRFTRLDREERFAASFGVGFAAAALCAFAAFVLHAPQPVFNLGAAALMLDIALWCRLTTAPRPGEDGPPVWPLAAVFLLAYLHLVCIQALLPAYWGSYWYFDWWMHYNEAQIFVGDESVTTTWAGSYTVASRTPLFNLATAFVMGAAGHDFDVYQLASALTNVCFILPAYLLLRDLFGRRAARLGLLLAPLNLWMLHNAWFTWPKMLAAYYLLLALHFYLRSVRERPADPARAGGYFVGFGAAALLAFMTHQSTIGYVLPLLAHAAYLAWRDWSLRPRPGELLACVLLTVGGLGPWYGWLAGTLGTETILRSSPVTQGDTSAKFRPDSIAKWMGFNLSVSVVPVGIGKAFTATRAPGEPAPPRSVAVYLGEWFELREGSPDTLRAAGLPDDVVAKLDPLKEKEFVSRDQFLAAVAGRLDDAEREQWQARVAEEARQERQWYVGPPDLVELYRGLLQIYFSLFTGALTLSLTAFLIVAGVRRLRRGPTLPATKPDAAGRAVWSAVWLSVAGGTLCGAFLHPGKIPWGIAHSAVFPTAIVLAALAWGLLSRARPRVRALVCCGMVLEFALMFWSYVWLADYHPGVIEPGISNPRTDWVRMLNEVLGGAESVFLIGAIIVQTALAVLLLWSCLRAAPVLGETE